MSIPLKNKAESVELEISKQYYKSLTVRLSLSHVNVNENSWKGVKAAFFDIVTGTTWVNVACKMSIPGRPVPYETLASQVNHSGAPTVTKQCPEQRCVIPLALHCSIFFFISCLS